MEQLPLLNAEPTPDELVQAPASRQLDAKVLLGPAGTGKCLCPSTPVLKFDGSVVRADSLVVGDRLMGPDSKPRTVLSTTSGVGPLYRVTPVRGDSWICNDVHMLTLAGTGSKEGQIRDIALNEILAEEAHRSNGRTDKNWKLFRVGVDFEARDLLVDPYLLGIWIGDGHKASVCWSLGEKKKPILDWLILRAGLYECEARVSAYPLKGVYKIRFVSKKFQKGGASSLLFEQLAAASITKDGKRTIRQDYLTGSMQQRLELLAGLIDTDGAVSANGVDYLCKDEPLRDAVLFLARSCGFAAYASEKWVQMKTWTEPRRYFRISISGDMNRLPTLRLKFKPRAQIKNWLRTGWSAESIGEGQYFGFELDGDGRFLLGDLTVTHNSTIIRDLRNRFTLLLTATTGIAAYNLGETALTINSVMGFYNLDSLKRNMEDYAWYRRVQNSLLAVDGLVIDEISMMHCEVLDLVTTVLRRINERRVNDGMRPLKVLLAGDFLQLPPVDRNSPEGTPPPYAFWAKQWNDVWAPNTIQLKHVFRQTDPRFLEALNYARRGMGNQCVAILRQAGVKFSAQPWYAFRGMTLYPTNASVDLHNRTRLAELTESQGFSLQAQRWGQQSDVLREIPDAVGFKLSCRVRVTANNINGGAITYVNGQLGTVIAYQDGLPLVHLDGQQFPVLVTPITRFAYRPLEPGDESLIDQTQAWLRDVAAQEASWRAKDDDDSSDGEDFDDAKLTEEMKKAIFPKVIENVIVPEMRLPFYDIREKMVAIGACQYVPLVLGYASTFHKSQGLTFDRVQIDIRNRFAGNPQMVYVALSRCRTLEGLEIIGTPDQLARRIITSPYVQPFI